MIGNQNSNVTGWRSLVNKLLDLPTVLQFAANTGMQALKYPTSNKHYPWFKYAIIPNIKGKASGLVAQSLNELLTEWMKPNLGGIVIEATSERQGRQVDVSENMIITQGQAGMNREYNTDNSAPHTRTWQIEGHLTQMIPYLDEHFILRPTLVVQQMLLDAYAASRRPVLYRSGLCPMPTQVLIEDYNIARAPESNNTYSVSLSLREFVSYKVPFYNRPGDTVSVEATAGELLASQMPGPPIDLPSPASVAGVP